MSRSTSAGRFLFVLVMFLSSLIVISATTRTSSIVTSKGVYQISSGDISEIVSEFVDQMGWSITSYSDPSQEKFYTAFDQFGNAQIIHEVADEYGNTIFRLIINIAVYSDTAETRSDAWQQGSGYANIEALGDGADAAAFYGTVEDDENYYEGAVFGCGELGINIDSFTNKYAGYSYPLYPDEVLNAFSTLAGITAEMGLCEGRSGDELPPPDSSSSSSSGANCSNSCAGITLDQLRSGGVSVVQCKASCFGIQPAGGGTTYSDAELSDCLSRMETAYQNCLASATTNISPPIDTTGGDTPPEQGLPIEGVPIEDVPLPNDEYPMDEGTIAVILASLTGSALITFVNWLRDRDLSVPYDGTIPSPIPGGGMVDPDVAQRQGTLLDRGWQWNADSRRFEPRFGATDENGNIWCQAPWEEGGPGWMSKSDFENIRSWQSRGYVWGGNQYGWVTPDELRERVGQYERFQQVNRAEDFNRWQKAQDIKAKKAELAKLDWERLKDNEYARKLDRNSVIGWESAKITFKALVTGQDTAGNISWMNIGARATIGLLSGGKSEWIFTPAYGAYSMHDRLAAGQDFLTAANRTAGEMILMELGGRALVKTAGAAGQLAKWGAKELGIIGKTAESSAGGLSKEALKQMGWDIGKAVASGDERAILGLYYKYGMKNMVELEKQGLLRSGAVREMNRVVSKNIDEAVVNGGTNVAGKFNAEGLEVEKMYFGNSGSRDTLFRTRSVLTDADRTLHVEFSPKSIDEYAKTHLADVYKVSSAKARAIAHDQLQARFASMHQEEVRGLMNKTPGMNKIKNVFENAGKAEKGAKDVFDYKTYPGMGQEGGIGAKADSFPGGITRIRQATLGQTTILRSEGQGMARTYSSYKTSGEAMVDANALYKDSILNMSGKSEVLRSKIVESLAPKSPPAELAQIAAQQVQGISKQGIPPTLAAKYVERAQYVATRSGTSLPNNLVNLAKSFRHPQAGYAILKDPAAQKAFIQNAQKVIKGVLGSL